MSIVRFDIGWRKPAGDYGVIYAPDGALADKWMWELIEWTDVIHDRCQEHWLLRSLGDAYVLARISPQAGGQRGTASTAQVMVIPGSDIMPTANIARLPSCMPGTPLAIGQASTWDTVNIADLGTIEFSSVIDDRSSSLETLLDSYLSAGNTVVTLPTRKKLATQEAEIREFLTLFALVPIVLRERTSIAFVTSSAPPTKQTSIRFTECSHAPVTASAPVKAWVYLRRYSDRWPVAEADLQDTRTLIRKIVDFEVLKAVNGNRVEPDLPELCRWITRVSTIENGQSNFLDEFESALGTLHANARLHWLAVLLDDAKACSDAGIPERWTLRLLATANTLAAASDSLTRKYALPLIEIFPAPVSKCLEALSTGQIVILLNSLGTRLDDVAWSMQFSSERHAQLIGEMFRIYLSRGEYHSSEFPALWCAMSKCVESPLVEGRLRSLAVLRGFSEITRNRRTYSKVMYAALDAGHFMQSLLWLETVTPDKRKERWLAISDAILAMRLSEQATGFRGLLKKLLAGPEFEKLGEADRKSLLLFRGIDPIKYHDFGGEGGGS